MATYETIEMDNVGGLFINAMNQEQVNIKC
jgi:hypothetical protein